MYGVGEAPDEDESTRGCETSGQVDSLVCRVSLSTGNGYHSLNDRVPLYPVDYLVLTELEVRERLVFLQETHIQSFSFLSHAMFYDAPKQDAIVKTLTVELVLTLRCVPEFDPVIQSSSERALQSSTNRSMMRFCCRLISNLTHTHTHTQAQRKRKGTI